MYRTVRLRPLPLLESRRVRVELTISPFDRCAPSSAPTSCDTTFQPVPTEQAPHKNTPLEEYNHNFLFPICELRSDKVIVTPFIPSLHAQAYFDGVKQDEYGVL